MASIAELMQEAKELAVSEGVVGDGGNIVSTRIDPARALELLEKAQELDDELEWHEGAVKDKNGKRALMPDGKTQVVLGGLIGPDIRGVPRRSLAVYSSGAVNWTNMEPFALA